MIAGIGCDIVDVVRFCAKLADKQGLRERLFTPAEQQLKAESLAARFAAKEALIKALGGSAIQDTRGQVVYDLRWHDMEVLPTAGVRPCFSDTSGLRQALQLAGVSRLHLSLAHDGGMAVAYVVAERSFQDMLQRSGEHAGESLSAAGEQLKGALRHAFKEGQ